MEKKLIRKQSLEKLYNRLSEKGKVYAPVIAPDKQIEYRYNPSYSEITFEHIRSTLSVKNLVFPKVENLFFYKNGKTESTIEDIDLSIIPEVVLWGAHPCDNAAFESLRSIFEWDIKDDFFSGRLEKLAVIGLSCHKADAYCFCTSVGISPRLLKGKRHIALTSENR